LLSKLFKKKSKHQKVVSDATTLHGIDEEMNYCPACGDEYRAAATRCVACDMDLISGSEKLVEILEKEQLLATRTMEFAPDDELVILRKGPLKEMKELQKLLSKQRIPAMLVGDEKSCGQGCCSPEMFLQIKKSDGESAMAVLSQDYIKSTALKSHDLVHVDTVFVQEAESNICPACGCRFGSGAEMICPECGLCFG